MNPPESVPRVFISYSHDSPEHADRVLALADRLRAEGIDCHLDRNPSFTDRDQMLEDLHKALAEGSAAAYSKRSPCGGLSSSGGRCSEYRLQPGSSFAGSLRSIQAGSS
jgi:hypothetical protein